MEAPAAASVLQPIRTMQTVRIPFLPFLILSRLPLLEIAGFVLVGSQIGVLPTLAWSSCRSIVGAVLLRIQGFRRDAPHPQARSTPGTIPSRELAHGVMILLAGMLLLIPGFVTDIIGLLLFMPPVRDLGWRLS